MLKLSKESIKRLTKINKEVEKSKKEKNFLLHNAINRQIVDTSDLLCTHPQKWKKKEKKEQLKIMKRNLLAMLKQEEEESNE